MSILIVFNHQPYDGSDVVYNGLRLAKTLQTKDEEVRIFLMNDAVDLARYLNGIELKACGTCQARCGINKNEPYFKDEIKGTMIDLANWVINSDKILTF